MMFPEMNQTKCMLWQKFAFYGSYNKFIIVYGNMKIYEAKKTMKMVRYLMGVFLRSDIMDGHEGSVERNVLVFVRFIASLR